MSNIIAIGIIAWWIAEGSGIVQFIKWWLCTRKIYYKIDSYNMLQQRRLKPFDCPLCIGWWIGFISTYIQTGSLNQSIAIGILSSACAIVVSKLINKL